MNYYFRKNLSVQESVRLIAAELVKEGIRECESDSLPHHQIIHEVRKKCKRIRGLLRIVRPSIEPVFREENIFFRDLARKLSGIRDQHAAAETLSKLSKKFNNKPISKDIKKLISGIKKSENKEESARLISEFRHDISKSIPRIKTWKVGSEGYGALRGGFRKTYMRGRSAMRRAFITPTAENYHEWRKRVKYHYYHLELLNPVWERVVQAYTDEVHELSEKLGYDRDLYLLSESLNYYAFSVLDKRANKKLLDAVLKEQSKLRHDISALGRKIYSEEPAAVVNRIGKLWDIWEKEK